MRARALLLPLVTALSACGGDAAPEAGSGDPAAADVATAPPLPELPTAAYQWDAKAGDPSVPAELGGPGFTGEGWLTATNQHVLGDPKAPQGGSVTMALDDWPPTLRIAGKDYNTYFNYMVRDLAYETLLELDPVTLDFTPRLATHWQMSEDRTTYRFRINPAARWSDGEEITADDVIATWKLHMDPTMLEPSSIMTFGKLEEPKKISKYIVEVKVKDESWRNLLYFSTSMWIMPAHEISITGAEYLDKYQFAYTAVSGPYHVRAEDIETGNSITITRRTDWWADSNPVYDGMYNIGSYKFVVVKDLNLRFEKLKKGELDYLFINKAQWWVEDLPEVDAVKRGLLVQRKFFTDAPVGLAGLALNMTRPPLDDLRVRKALQHLLDRPTMIDKLFYNEYQPYTSYFQSGGYANPNNAVYEYDELRAVELLEEAGWKELDAEGYRTKDGRRLELTITYRSQSSERWLTVLQESAKRAGIKLELQLLTPAAAFKNMLEREYELQEVNWGGLVFPNPETSFHGRLAKEKNNNNVTGYSNPKVDALCERYDREYDVRRRIELIREIDALVYADHPYVLAWFQPSQRMAYWNKFGMPEWGSRRFDDKDLLHVLWWVDPEKEQQLAAARADATATMDPGPKENRFWERYTAAHSAARPTTSAEPTAPAAAPADDAAGAKGH